MNSFSPFSALLIAMALLVVVACSKNEGAKTANQSAGTQRTASSGSRQATATEENQTAAEKTTASSADDVSANSESVETGTKKSASTKAEPSDSTSTIEQEKDPAASDQEALANKKYEAINTEYAEALTALNAEMEKLSSEEQKAALFKEKNPELSYSKKLFALANQYPKTKAAFTAGMTIIVEYPGHQEFPATMDLILEHHGSRVEWHRIAQGYLEVVPSMQVEGWMRKMIASAGNDLVKVQMTYLLYRYFDQFPTFASTIEYNPEIKKRFSKDRIDYIYNRKNQVRDELLSSLKELKTEYADVAAEGSRKVKELIDGPIFELEHLQVGSIAPEIEGLDFDGVEFKLSDYRGKVVMLDFWGQWCPPCRAMFPHERELIEQLVGMPFVLIGVNSDRRLETAIKATKDQNLVWRNFWCGPQGRIGPIAKKWNVSAWPTVYLIDGEGVIRYKEVLGRDIDKGIEALLSEMGHSVSLTSKHRELPFRIVNRKVVPNLSDLIVKRN